MQHKLLLVIVIVLVMAVIFFGMRYKLKRKETWFSRDLNYGKANSKLWDATVKKGVRGIAEIDADIRKMYPYRGYGNYIGFICKEKHNKGCTAYANYFD